MSHPISGGGAQEPQQPSQPSVQPSQPGPPPEPPRYGPPGQDQPVGAGAPTPGAPGYGSPQPGPEGYGTGYPAGQPMGQPMGQPAGYGSPAGPTLMSPADQRTWGMLAHLSGIVASFIGLSFLGPLVIYLVTKDRGGFVRRHSAEALNYQILLNLIVVVGVILGFATLTVGFIAIVPIWIIVGIAALVFIIIAAVKASHGEEYRIPLNLRLVK